MSKNRIGFGSDIVLKNGNVGFGTTNPQSKLFVSGDGYFTGILTANRIFSSVYGEFTGGSISGTNLVGTSLSISGISTLGITSATNLTAQQLNVSGVSTLPTLTGTTATYNTLNVSDGYINTGIVTTLIGTNLSYSGIATIGTLGVSGVTTTRHLSVTGVSTLGIASATNLTAQTLNVSGIVTGYSFRPSSGYYQSANGTNAFYVYDGTGNVAFQGTIGASQINSASGYKALDFTSTTTPFVNITNGLNVGTGGTILTTTSFGLIGIGSTNPTSKLDIIGDVKLTGVITATTFSGQVNAGVGTITTLSGTTATYNTLNVSSGYINTGIITSLSGTTATYNTGNFTTGYINTGIVTALTSTNATLTNINSSGISTLGVTSSIDFTAQQLNITGLSTHIGISTFKSSLFGAEASFTGVVTASSFSGNASSATKLETARTFEITGDVVASAISFDGTGNVSLAATIQPNSVALGNDTTGDYVQSITGTSNQITVTGGTGEGSTPTLSVPNQFTAPQDVTVTRDLQVNRNLNVNGNITIGGTSAVIYATELKVYDPDIVLGIRTDALGNDISTDNTANHGGISIASTEGNPLVSLYNPGIGESTPATYKKIMWFKSGAFAGLNTDAWLSNYAIGIGSTQFPTGTRLAVGNVQFAQNDLTVVRNINASGIVTATTFVGAFTGTATSTTNIPNLTGDVTSNNTTTTLATVNSNVGTYGDAGAIPSITVNAKGLVTGVTTIAPNNGTLNLGVSGTGLSGSATFTANQSGSSTFTVTSNATDANTASAIVARDASGNFSAGTITANLTGNASSATYATSAGVSTSVIGGIASVSQLNVTGISTVGFLTATNIWNSGVTTSSSFVKINGTSSQFLKADGSVDSSTYLTTTGSGTNLTGIVTYITSGSGILVSQNTGNVTITGVGTQWLTTSVGIHTLSNVGIGTSNPTEKLTVSGKIQLQQDSASNNRLVLRGQPSSSYRWNVDNYGSSNDFRIFREDDATAANGSVAVSISTTGTVTATKFSGDGSLLTGITASGSGVVVKDDGVLTGTATTIDFGTNLSVSFSSGTATITASGGSSSQWVTTSAGIHTLSNVGIGTTNPTQKLEVVGGEIKAGRIDSSSEGGQLSFGRATDNTTGWYIDVYGSTSTPDLRFVDVSNAAVRAVIDGSGNFGMKNATPTSALDVSGDAKVSGVATAGSFVKSGGTSSQFLKADGSVDSNTYLTTTGSGTNLTGIVTSIIAGTNISVSGSTGRVTINSTGISSDARLLSISEKLLYASSNTVDIVYGNSSSGNVGISTNPTGDITLNVTGIPTDSTFDSQVITFSVIVNQTGTARSCTAVTLNGVSKTILWPGGSLASAIAGITTTRGYDIYGFTGINTIGSASTTANYVVLGIVNGGFR